MAAWHGHWLYNVAVEEKYRKTPNQMLGKEDNSKNIENELLAYASAGKEVIYKDKEGNRVQKKQATVSGKDFQSKEEMLAALKASKTAGKQG